MENYIGKKINKLTIISKEKHLYKGYFSYKCKCVCGNEIVGSIRKILNGCLSACPKCIIELWDRYLSVEIKKAGYVDFNGTNEQFYNLIIQNCYYCEASPSNKTTYKRKKHVLLYNGLDRVDNNRGHDIDNVVTCCKRCNLSKRDMTQQDFFDFIIKSKIQLEKRRLWIK